MPNNSTRRPVCRLSLRGLLLLVAVFGVWLTGQSRWIRERDEARRWIVKHEADGNWSAARPDDVTTQRIVAGKSVWTSAAERAGKLPWSLRLAGECPLYYIYLDKGKLSEKDGPHIDSLRTLFPEAFQIQVVEPRKTTAWPPSALAAFFGEPSSPDPAGFPRP